MAVKGDLSVWEAESEGIELKSQKLGDLLDRQAEENPGKEALIYNYPELGINLRYNYDQYRAEVNRVAKGLLALGVQRGEHVAVWAPNIPQWVLLYQALSRIGAVLVTINSLYRTAEVEYVLRQGDISRLFMVEEVRGNSYLDSIYSIAPELKIIADPAAEMLKSANLPRLKQVVLIGRVPRAGLLLFHQMVEMGQVIADEQLQERKSVVSPQDVAMIMYTSGTTGFPKGAMLTHYNIINTVRTALGVNYDPDERSVSPMPLFHIAGSNFATGMTMTGATFIPMLSFDPVKLMELVDKEKGTSAFCVPAMITAWLNNPRFQAGEFDLSSFKRIHTGGAPVPVVLMEQVREKLGADCRIYFGMTKSTGAATMTRDIDSFELKSATVGKPYPNLEVKIVNLTTSQPVPLGQSGELLVRGFVVMKGYYNMPAMTAEAIDPEGWLHTGDLATMNSAGYVNIVGRLKELVIRGGENIYPAEIESFLMRHPSIAEAQVLGVPDKRFGEELAALLKLKPGQNAGEEEIREYCRANISQFKIPRYIRFTSEFPMTASGKVKKYELKEQLIQELGLVEGTGVKTA